MQSKQGTVARETNQLKIPCVKMQIGEGGYEMAAHGILPAQGKYDYYFLIF